MDMPVLLEFFRLYLFMFLFKSEASEERLRKEGCSGHHSGYMIVKTLVLSASVISTYVEILNTWQTYF